MLYLDIDGVLNPDNEAPNTWGDWRRKKLTFNKGGGLLETIKIDWSPALVAALWETTGGNITWHTSWNLTYKSTTYANHLGTTVFGWPPLPDTGSPVEGAAGKVGEWWKLTLLKQSPPDGPFVWIDDDFAFEPDAIDWVENAGGLAIITNPELGLIPVHLDQIQRYYDGT